MIDLFNKQLTQLSHRLTSLRITRNQLIQAEDLVFETVLKRDQDEKGFLTQNQIIEQWINLSKHSQEDKHQFIEAVFPFEQISYSAIVKYTLEKSSGLEKKKEAKMDKIEQKISQVLQTELQNFIIIKQINQNLIKFVPTTYMKPTKKQFYDYVVCQQLALDIEAVSKVLNLSDLPPPIQRTKIHQQFSEGLGNYGVQTLQKTMSRLKQRMKNFGNEWLS